MDSVLTVSAVQSVLRWGLLWPIAVLPLVGALWNALLGGWGQKRFGHRFVHVPAVAAMAGSFAFSLVAVVRLFGLSPEDRFLWDPVYRMLEVGSLSVDFAFAMDPLGAVMALVVTGVGTLIHVYSIGYMHEEPSYWRFFCYLNLFCFAMLLLVLGDGFFLMFFGWEGVGLCSYLLIGFWYRDIAKASAGMKAFVVNRIGDFGFVVGMALLFWTLGGVWGLDGFRAHPGSHVVAALVQPAAGSHAAAPLARTHPTGTARLTVTVHPGAIVELDGRPIGKSPLVRRSVAPGDHRVEVLLGHRSRLSTTASLAPGHETALVVVGPTLSFRQIRDQLSLERREGDSVVRLRDRFGQKTLFGIAAVTLVCLFFFLGAAGKSAQLPLYVWLPDAMAGPTPVSALIHAATMVTAGVYLVARLGFLYAMTPAAMTVVAIVGAITALFAATIGFFQTDIKKVLAYSTVSQLGFMFVAVGVGAYWAGVFHLVTHAFFKACLFLGAGSVIHGMHHVEHGEADSQDMRRMGGLAKVMPWTARTYWVACVAITAAPLPLFAGFWSKDEILWKAFTTRNIYAPGWLVWGLCAAAAFCTAFYMWRSWYLTFAGEPRREIAEKVHESPATMVSVLVVLGVLSVVGGIALVGLPSWLGGHPFLERFLEPVTAPADAVFAATGRGFADAGHGLERIFVALSIAIALSGWALARWRYRDRVAALAWEPGVPGHRLLLGKYFVDELYARTVVAAFMQTRLFLGQFDRWVVDGVVNGAGWGLRAAAWIGGKIDELLVDGFVNWLSEATLRFGRGLRTVQDGRIQRYVYGVVTGALVLAVAAYFSPQLLLLPRLLSHYFRVGP